ncbi:mitogen-activated protein kinase kinase kinase 20-like [Patiria miniata]|uniref:Protein kinase domain-containing protein n=1 Tax=Patiria miniata TaxID=46514 RepID=A0A914BHL1_PATMI|nr:mitogen-activated protein kinase kinase kinase 20-like [Patiria miniata]
MARGLHYIHQQKYQHGDVKSQNMVITRDDTLKICDFGTARHCESTFTTENIRGSWAWMAPEVIGERHNSQPQTKAKVTHKSDVFSYAVVVWELLTGKEPFAGETTLDFMQATGGQRRRLEIPKECPQTLRDLLTKCWDHDHTKRPRMDEILSRSELGRITLCSDFDIDRIAPEPYKAQQLALKHVALDDYTAQKEDEFGCTASHDTPPSESEKEMIRPVCNIDR